MIKLNLGAWMEIIREEFAKATLDAAEYIRNDATLFNRSGVVPHVSFTESGTRFEALIWAEGMKAVIAEWGSGSQMDLSNPFLPMYQSSPDYNPERLNQGTTAILGRPEGTYTDLDGVQHYSSGNLAGVNLEDGHIFQAGGEVQYTPHEAEHYMRDAVMANKVIINERFILAIKNSFRKIPIKGEG